MASSIALEPIDWMRAAWRRVPPLPRPEVPAFDFKFSCGKLSYIPRGPIYDREADWRIARVPVVMTREEALFWFTAFAENNEQISARDLSAAVAARWPVSDALSAADILARLKPFAHLLPEEAVAVLANLLPLTDVLSLLVEGGLATDLRLVRGFHRLITPYLADSEREPLRHWLRLRVEPARWPVPLTNDHPPIAFLLAANLGMPDEMLRVVESWPDQLRGIYHRDKAAGVVFGLGSAGLVLTHFRRLGLGLKGAPRRAFSTAELTRGWLACTELAGLDLFRDEVLSASSRDEANELMEVFCLVHAPEAAPHMLQLRRESKAPHLASQWLADHPQHAIPGLVPLAASRGKLAEDAVQYLREAGHRELIEQALQAAPAEVAERVRRLVLEHEETNYPPFEDAALPDWLREALESHWQAQEKPLPAWVRVEALPPLVVSQHALRSEDSASRLTDAHVRRMLSGLKQSTLRRWPLVEGVQKHVAEPFRDAFVWKLFEMFLAEGGPSKDRWAMLALGFLGGDGAALKLAALIRAWPGEGQQRRAVTGLECLRTIGTDAALVQLGDIARKSKFKGIQKKAREMMDGLAKDRGLSREALEDRIVPDLGFEEQGRRILDYGPRQFEVVLGDDLSPQVRDADGNLRDDPPKPGVKDDRTRAKTALAEWKMLKKQLREVLKTQALRLEQSMIASRRWTLREFEQRLARHPLLTILARRLVWLGHDATQRICAFRLTAEGEYADEQDRPCSGKGIASVALAHPLVLTPEERTAWSELLGDYEIVPPFPQLSRPFFAVTPEQLESWHGRKCTTGRLSALETRGWVRGDPADGTLITHHTRHFPGTNVTARLDYRDGFHLGDYEGEQEIESVSFRAEQPLAPGEVPPIILSEVVADLNALR